VKYYPEPADEKAGLSREKDGSRLSLFPIRGGNLRGNLFPFYHLFRDHEKRITCLEAWHTQHDLDDKKDHEGSAAFEAVVRERLHLR